MSSKQINILMYHQVGDFSPIKKHQSTYIHYKRFATHMAYLAHGGYTVLRLDQALACLAGQHPTPPRSVVITFDDGYENFYEYAWPVLQKYKFPAMVYLISGLIGQPAKWFAADGRATPALMDATRIRQLRKEGVDFGSHGATHVKLAEQSTERIAEEMHNSRIALSELLDEDIRHFCYPYGSHDLRCIEAAAQAGYTSAVTCERAQATPDNDPLALPRKAISYGDNPIGLFWRMHVKNTPKYPLLQRPGAKCKNHPALILPNQSNGEKTNFHFKKH